MRIVFLVLLLALAHLPSKAQAVPDDYKFVGQIETSRFSINEDVLLSPDGKYLVTNFGYKPSTVEVYEIEGWKKVQTFSIKGWVYFFGAFFDKDDSNIFYLDGRRKKMHKLDIIKGSHEALKRKELPAYSSDYRYSFWVNRQPSRTEEDGIFMRMLPEKYVIKIYKDVIRIYIWKDLLE